MKEIDFSIEKEKIKKISQKKEYKFTKQTQFAESYNQRRTWTLQIQDANK